MAVIQQIDITRLGSASFGQLGLLAAAVTGNLIVTTAIWWVITLSFDTRPKVQPSRMAALICVSALLNYLPMRPGFLGRAAYLKLMHGLPVRQSLVILLIVLVLGTVVLIASATIVLWVPSRYQLVVGMATVAATSAVTGPLATKLLRRRIIGAWLWVPLRLVDILINGVRLWLALAIVGIEVPMDRTLIVAATGMLVSLAGITPNGLGLREWIIAALAGALEPATVIDALAAALIDRAVEAIVVTGTGLACLPMFGSATPLDDGSSRHL